MLTIFRRHLATCKYAKKGRKYRSCGCPISVEGTLRGEMIRRSLDLRSWEAAQKLMRDWEIDGKELTISVEGGGDKYLDDVVARKLSAATLRKYQHHIEEIKIAWKDKTIRSVTVDDVRTLRKSWNLSGLTTTKRLEFVRGFSNFCLDSGWIEKNPAKAVKPPKVKQTPTLPFTEGEMTKLLWAVDALREIHPLIPESTEKKIRAMIPLMRYSGIRVSDAVVMKPDRIADGKLFLYTQKTGTPVWCPVPKKVTDALAECDEGDPYYFWSGNGKVKSMITEWQERMKKVCVIAGIPDGHFHRLRDTSAVSLLERGVPIETVAVLLGNTVQVCQKHYAPWVKARQDALETAVMGTW